MARQVLENSLSKRMDFFWEDPKDLLNPTSPRLKNEINWRAISLSQHVLGCWSQTRQDLSPLWPLHISSGCISPGWEMIINERAIYPGGCILGRWSSHYKEVIPTIELSTIIMTGFYLEWDWMWFEGGLIFPNVVRSFQTWSNLSKNGQIFPNEVRVS